MEPLSILGAAGSIVGIIDVASRCISSLHALQQRWKDADMTVALMMGQISTLKAALEQISQWMHTDADTLSSHYQLVMDLELALNSSRISITFLDDHVATLMRDQYNELTFNSRARAMVQDTTVQQCAKHLNNQTVALNLLLTALNCRSLSEQRSLLLDKDNRQIIEQIKDNSSSLVCLFDSASFCSSRSGFTDRASLWSRNFEFDGDLLGSKVYKGQIRLLMKGSTGKRAKPQDTSNPTACENILEDEVRKQSQKQQKYNNLTGWEDFSGDESRKECQKLQETSNLTGCENSSEDDLRRTIQEQEILLLGPDDYARIILLEKLQSVFDPAGKISRFKHLKDEYIRYHLPAAICHIIHTEFFVRHTVVTNDEKVNAGFQQVRQYEESSCNGGACTQLMDALATLWNDKNIRQALVNAKNLEFWDSFVGTVKIDSICHTLDLITFPEYLPTAVDIAKMKRWNTEVEKITFQVSEVPERLYTYKDEKREAQAKPPSSGVMLFSFIDLPSSARCSPIQFDDVPIRIIVVDLLDLHRAAGLPTISIVGQRGRILEKLGVEDYVDNLWDVWYAKLPNMIILICGDDFLTVCASDTWQKTGLEYGGNENIQAVRRSLEAQLKQECSYLHPYDMDVHIMWRYDDAEIHRLYNAIRDLQVRITIKDQVA